MAKDGKESGTNVTLGAADPRYTRTMKVVHHAVRRDLSRARHVPHSTSPGDVQRVALADHLLWMMHFLHQHHRSEDIGLWPLVRALNPAAAPLLDADGTVVTHAYSVTRPPSGPFARLYQRLHPQHADTRPQMRANLEALRRLAGGETPASAARAAPPHAGEMRPADPG